MVFGIGDELSVKISASTSEFTSKVSAAKGRLESFGDEVGETGRRASRLSGRLESVGDELTGVSARAATSSGALASASAAMSAFNTSSFSTGATLSLTLLPALALLATTLAPLTAALGGLAAVLGSIAAVGVVGVASSLAVNFEKLKTAATAVRDAVVQAVQPIAEAFTPVIIELLQLIPGLVEQIVPAQETLNTLAEQFRALGIEILTALPPLAEIATELATRFLPALTDLVSGAASRAPSLIRSLVRTFEQVLAILRPLGRALANSTAGLTTLGLTTLQTVVPALTSLVQVIGRVSTALGNLDKSSRELVIGATLAASAVGALATLLSGPVAVAIAAVVGAVIGLRRVWETNFGGVRQIVQSVTEQLRRDFSRIESGIDRLLANSQLLRTVVSGALPAVETAFSTSLTVAAGTLQTFTDLLGTTVQAVADLASGDTRGAITRFADFFTRTFKGIVNFFSTDPIVGAVLSSLAQVLELTIEFGRRLRVTGFSIFNQFANAALTAFTGLAGSVTTVLDGLVQTFVSGLNQVIGVVNDAIETANETVPGFDRQTFQSLTAPELGQQVPETALRPTSRERLRREENIAVNVDVGARLTDDGQLVVDVQDVAREESERTIRQRERRTRRINQRGTR